MTTGSTDFNASDPDNKKLFAVMYFSNPPAPWKAEDWYWTKVAGVPFLLRNILNLQKGGITNLILSIGKLESLGTEWSRRISEDSRIRLNLNWVSEPNQLSRCAPENEDMLILDGQTLYQPQEIQKAAALKSGDPVPAELRLFPVASSALGSTLEQIHHNGAEAMLWNEVSIESGPADRQLVYLRGGDTSRITRYEDFRDRHHQLLRSCGLSNDSFMDRLITRSVSRQLTRLFLATPLSPNQITALSLVLGLGSAWFFYQGGYAMGLAGSSLLLLSAWIDCTDGEVARLKFMESKLGSQLDLLSDNLVHIAVFFCIGMGLFRVSGEKVYLLLGCLAVLGSLVSFYLLKTSIVESKSRAKTTTANDSISKNTADSLANRDFIYFILAMAIIGKLEIFIALAGVGANVFAGYLLVSRLRRQSE